MVDWRKNKFLGIFVIINIIGLIIMVGIVIIGSFLVLNNIKSVSNEVQEKLDNTNELLTKLNSNIQGLDQLNKQINEINNRLSSIENSIQTDVKQQLHNLTQIYPPNQTLIINDISQKELNKIINNAVNIEFNQIKLKTNVNLIFNIIFGSLLSLTGGIGIYYLAKKKE